MLDRVFGRETRREFLSFCSRRGWVDESVVEVNDFEQCLRDFQNEHPEHAHNVI